MARTIWSKVNGRTGSHSIKILFIYDVVYGFTDKFAFEIGFDWHFACICENGVTNIHDPQSEMTKYNRFRLAKSYIQCTMCTIDYLKTISTTDEWAGVLTQTPTQSKSTIDINMVLPAEHIMHWQTHELNMPGEWQTLGNALSKSVVVLSFFVAAALLVSTPPGSATQSSVCFEIVIIIIIEVKNLMNA